MPIITGHGPRLEPIFAAGTIMARKEALVLEDLDSLGNIGTGKAARNCDFLTCGKAFFCLISAHKEPL